MKYSTAKWIVISLSSAAIVAISTYFYLDEKDKMIPFLSMIIKPFMMITLFPAMFLLASMLMADKEKLKEKEMKSEKRINGKIFKRAIILLAVLLSFKLFTTYFSK